MRVLVACLSIVALIASSPGGASSCSAKCTGCSSSSPSCKTGSLCEATFCQNGQCGGLHVGCCCQTGGAFLCVDVPCGSGKLDPQNPGGRVDGGSLDWAVLEYTVDLGGQIVDGPTSPFASSSRHAGGVVPERGQVQQPAGTYFRLVVDSPPPPGPPSELGWLEDRLAELDFDEHVAARVGLRVIAGQVEVLFATDPDVADRVVGVLGAEHGKRPIDGIYMIEISGGRVGVVHAG